ncbi:21905_t:CDS:1, partial [Racocetra persica]
SLTDEKELDIRNKFIIADDLIKVSPLKSLLIPKNKYYSKLIPE